MEPRLIKLRRMLDEVARLGLFSLSNSFRIRIGWELNAYTNKSMRINKDNFLLIMLQFRKLLQKKDDIYYEKLKEDLTYWSDVIDKQFQEIFDRKNGRKASCSYNFYPKGINIVFGGKGKPKENDSNGDELISSKNTIGELEELLLYGGEFHDYNEQFVEIYNRLHEPEKSMMMHDVLIQVKVICLNLHHILKRQVRDRNQ